MLTASDVYRSDLLAGKVILVTGGGTGIGLRIAAECASLGASIAISGRGEDRLEEAAEQLRAGGAMVHAAPLDIRDPEAGAAWVSEVAQHYGHVDVLVNNAGGQYPSPALDIVPKGWRAVVETNLNGTWFMSQAFAAHQIAQEREGRIINIVANMWRGFPGMAHTGAARAGVVNLTRSLALEWATKGILVNAVAPGVIRSTGLDSYPQAVRDLLETEVPKHIPLRRLGEVEDVAWAVVYLAGPAGRYITGEAICVDGGQQHWGTVFPV
jgi:citronellol/citronellal dehydrogenase